MKLESSIKSTMKCIWYNIIDIVDIMHLIMSYMIVITILYILNNQILIEPTEPFWLKTAIGVCGIAYMIKAALEFLEKRDIFLMLKQKGKQ